MCKSGERTMCAILLSPELGLFRVYPIPAEIPFKVWSEISIQLEKSTSDNRSESWKLVSWERTGEVKYPSEKRSILDACVIKTADQDPITYQNDNRKSVALVQLHSYTPALESKQSIRDDDHWVMTQQKSWNKPYISWKSDQGSEHKTHLVGREVYEGLRRNPERPWEVFSNMQLNNADFDHWLLLGNLRDRRNVWVGVHVHRLKKTSSLSMLPCCSRISGESEGWPYSQQETGNVPIADNQQLMFTMFDM